MLQAGCIYLGLINPCPETFHHHTCPEDLSPLPDYKCHLNKRILKISRLINVSLIASTNLPISMKPPWSLSALSLVVRPAVTPPCLNKSNLLLLRSSFLFCLARTIPYQTSRGISTSLAEVSAAVATQSKPCSFIKVLVPVLLQRCGDFSRAFVTKESPWTIGTLPPKGLLHPGGRAKAPRLPGCPATVDVESSLRPGRKGGLGLHSVGPSLRPSHNPGGMLPPALASWAQNQPHPHGDKTGDLDSTELSL